MTNPTKTLTDKQVAALKPQAAPYRVTDAAGLFLVVQPSGLKVWRTKYKRDGKTHLLKLGEYPAMSLLQARRARLDVRHQVVEGHHISRERVTAKAARVEAGTLTVEAMARHWHATMLRDRWGASYARQLLQRLEANVFPAIGARPIGEVTRAEIIDLIERCRVRCGVAQANRVRVHLVNAWDDWLDRELITTNPCNRLAARTVQRDHRPQPAVLTVEAARAVLAKVEASDWSADMKLFHRFLALTGLRSTEVREARWDEFDGDVWRIPAERMKGRRGRKRGHVVFLSPQALEVIAVSRARAPAGAVFAFPTHNYGRRRDAPFGRSSLCKVLKDTLGARVHVAHGWRATMATVLRARHPEAKDLVQVMLAHQTKDQVARLYDRTDEAMFEPKLRPLATEWAALLLDGAPSAWSLAGLPAPSAEIIELRRAA